jgi:hypothetical protein
VTTDNQIGVFGEGSQLCGTPGFARCEDELCDRCRQPEVTDSGPVVGAARVREHPGR